MQWYIFHTASVKCNSNGGKKVQCSGPPAGWEIWTMDVFLWMLPIYMCTMGQQQNLLALMNWRNYANTKCTPATLTFNIHSTIGGPLANKQPAKTIPIKSGHVSLTCDIRDIRDTRDISRHQDITKHPDGTFTLWKSVMFQPICNNIWIRDTR